MGVFDSFKEKAADAVDTQGDKIGEGADMAKDHLDGMDGQDDDIQ